MYEEIQDFFDLHNITPKKENVRSFIFDCPACGGHEKLYIEKLNGRAICFKHKTAECPTARSGINYVLALISGLPIDTVRKEMSKDKTSSPTEVLVLEDKKPKQKADPDALVPIEAEQLPIDAQPIDWPGSEPGLKYLEGRGLDKETLVRHGILYSAQNRRVIFPAIMNGKIYGWQGRAIEKNNPLRMYNLPGPWKTKSMLFHDNLKNSEFAIIAEGAVSALKFARVGGYIATMGKMVSSSQIEIILNSGVKKIYMALDPDAIPEMQALVQTILQKTNNAVQCLLIKVPEGRDDFGDCTYEECINAFQNASNLDFDCFNLYSYAMERM